MALCPRLQGETLLEHSRTMLSSARRVAQDMGSFSAGVRGHVRLLATVSSIAESLPDDVAAFMSHPGHREISVDIQEALSRDIVRQLREGGATVGILWDAADLEGLASTPYRLDHLSVVAHASHPLASKKRCTFEATLDYEHVGLEASAAVNLMLARAAAIAGKRMVYRATVSNFEASLRVVRANLGISIIPQEVATPYADAFNLRVIPLSDAWAKRRFAICFRGKDQLPKAASLLVDFLKEAAAR